MAYGVDKYPDPPDDGMDDEEREALHKAEDGRVERELDRAMEDDNGLR